MSANPLEKSLGGAFKSAPKLPVSAKNLLVAWMPWLSLLAGLLSLWAAYSLYHWAHFANALTNYANSLSEAFGGGKVVSSRWSVTVWVGLAVLAVEGLIYLAAFPGLRARKYSGWSLILYATVLNAVYGVVSLFTDYGGGSSLVGYIISTAIGLYLLFQVRDAFNG